MNSSIFIVFVNCFQFFTDKNRNTYTKFLTTSPVLKFGTSITFLCKDRILKKEEKGAAIAAVVNHVKRVRWGRYFYC